MRPKNPRLAEDQVQVFIHKLAAALDVLKGAVNRNEDDDVGGGDGQQEKCGNGGSDDSPDGSKELNRFLSATEVRAIATDKPKTMVEWPREKKKPTATGRLPCCISLRVTLSIAAMWSASTA
jgi:hypothetical protein